MAYRALYRIYRPASFEEVAGQDHITDVLRNQVKLGRLSHAYLFCGPRGTGKTTMAKILSKAANCLHPLNGEPCGVCEMCRISAVVNADILEIDAASNNGVDNVRELIDQAQFAPLQLKKRVFIIDEVHMLSQSAFNALLKTLEEPPEHVLFILATTEPEKLLATVISRCQRFDFKRLSMTDIVNYMEKVLKKEDVSADKDALRVIAHAADGGMRDALSLLNQCISVSGKNLSSDDVRSVLGSVEEDLLFSLSDMIFNSDGYGCMKIIEKVVRDGKDLGVLTKDLSAHIRALLLTSICGRCADLLETTEDCAIRYEQQAGTVSKNKLLYISEELIKVRASIRYFPNPRLLLETTLLRMCCPEEERNEAAILSRISSMEKRLDSLHLSNSSALLPETEDSSLSDNITSLHISCMPLKESNENETDVSVGRTADDLTESATDYIAECDLKKNMEISVADNRAISYGEMYETSLEYEVANKCDTVPSRVYTDEIYERFKDALTKINALSTMALSSLSGKRLTEDKLLLYYDPSNVISTNLLTKQPILGQLQEAAEKAKPGLKVILQELKPDSVSTDNSKLQELFGEKLTIE